MTQSVFEIVTYTVTDAAWAEEGRRRARASVAKYAGFVGWQSYSGGEGATTFVDHVEWQTMDTALAAQTRFMRDSETELFRRFFGTKLAMTHVLRVD